MRRQGNVRLDNYRFLGVRKKRGRGCRCDGEKSNVMMKPTREEDNTIGGQSGVIGGEFSITKFNQSLLSFLMVMISVCLKGVMRVRVGWV